MNFLEKIAQEQRERVRLAKRRAGLPAMLSEAGRMSPTRGFCAALQRTAQSGEVGLIGEIKKASPSAGVIRQEVDVADLALAYQAARIPCVSVLTEEQHFHGAPEDLTRVGATVPMPILRKDFLVDPWQVVESRCMGADCILVIVAMVTEDAARELVLVAHEMNLDVLVEVHDERDLEVALNLPGPAMIGINARNLRDLTVDLAIPERLAAQVPGEYCMIAESGIRSREDIVRLEQSGFRHFLVGEALMRADDPGLAAAALRGEVAPVSAGNAVPPVGQVRPVP